MAKDSEAVEVAKVTARQAVMIALITAAAGVITGILASKKEPSAKAAHWLRIERIEAPSATPMRLVINVNGIPYSYPSTVVWVVPGPDIPHQRFPLPDASEYHISFRAITADRATDRDIQESSDVDVVRSFPSENKVYDLWPGAITRGAPYGPPTHVRYSVE